MADKKKKPFDWEAGKKLSQDLYDPVGNVRDLGFTKLANGIYADPQLRKEDRKKKLLRPVRLKGKEILIEESVSGLTEDFTPTNAAKLLHKETKSFKGIQRFIKPTKDTKKKTP